MYIVHIDDVQNENESLYIKVCSSGFGSTALERKPGADCPSPERALPARGKGYSIQKSVLSYVVNVT